MSGFIGRSGTKSGIVACPTVVAQPGGGSSIWINKWYNEVGISADATHANSDKTLSGFTIGSRVMIFINFIYYGGSGSLNNGWKIYLNSSDKVAAGLTTEPVLIANDLQFAHASWEGKSQSVAHVTEPISTTTPNYNIYADEYGASVIYYHAKGTFIELKE